MDTRPKPDEIREELLRIKASYGLKKSEKGIKILEYLIEKRIADAPIDDFGEQSIGMGVYGKDFDRLSSGSVKAAIGRLRMSLFTYYEKEGKDNPLRIEITSTYYVPEIRYAKPPAESVVKLVEIPELPPPSLAEAQSEPYRPRIVEREIPDPIPPWESWWKSSVWRAFDAHQRLVYYYRFYDTLLELIDNRSGKSRIIESQCDKALAELQAAIHQWSVDKWHYERGKRDQSGHYAGNGKHPGAAEPKWSSQMFRNVHVVLNTLAPELTSLSSQALRNAADPNAMFEEISKSADRHRKAKYPDDRW